MEGESQLAAGGSMGIPRIIPLQQGLAQTGVYDSLSIKGIQIKQPLP